MRVRIVKALPATLEGYELQRYALDGVYDIGRSLSELLIVHGFAIPEEERTIDRPQDVQEGKPRPRGSRSDDG